jgi:hypothetical protein
MSTKMNEKNIVALYREASRLASAALAGEPGLAERAEVHSLACSLIAGQLVTPKAGNAVSHGGADSDQESMLQDSYETGSQAGR